MPKPAEKAQDDSMLDVPARGIGDNSSGSGVAGEELRLLIERIERMKAEVKALNDDIKDVFGEGKARGFDPTTMRKIIAIRAKIASSKEAWQEEQAILETYMAALGMA